MKNPFYIKTKTFGGITLKYHTNAPKKLFNELNPEYWFQFTKEIKDKGFQITELKKYWYSRKQEKITDNPIKHPNGKYYTEITDKSNWDDAILIHDDEANLQINKKSILARIFNL